MARLHISVAQMGKPDWPRFAVQDNKGRYWNGNWWSKSLREALLYSSEREAADEAMVMNECVEPRWFVATVRIMVEHDEGFTIEQLHELLRQAAVSLVLPDQHDMDGVDIEIHLDLGGMEEVE